MTCPVCDAVSADILLELKGSPIYQHPVPVLATVPEPYTRDLRYFICKSCGHAYQDNFDAALMDKVYQSYYYTPAPEGVGATFRKEFIEFLLPHLQPNSAGAILEIGSSSGEILAQLRDLLPGTAVLGFEPSTVTSQRALANGIPTLQKFFSPATVAEAGSRFSCIISRHVIEHITGFDDFFAAIDTACADEKTLLVLETPALDVHWAAASIAPFHIEHAHVFSTHSLAKLAARYGWNLAAYRITESQNLIAVFSRVATPLDIELPVVGRSYADYFKAFREKFAAAANGRKIILWGAGSGGIKLVNYHHLEIEHLVDGNQEKKGMKFLGVQSLIEYAPECIAQIQAQDRDEEYAVLIGSGFYREIGDTLRKMNWRGGIIAPYAPDFLRES